MGFPRQEYWCWLPFPFPGDFANSEIESMSPSLAGSFFTTEPPGKPKAYIWDIKWFLEKEMMFKKLHWAKKLKKKKVLLHLNEHWLQNINLKLKSYTVLMLHNIMKHAAENSLLWKHYSLFYLPLLFIPGLEHGLISPGMIQWSLLLWNSVVDIIPFYLFLFI